jgi:hypothetical protein
MTDEQRLARFLAEMRERCRQNAELARTDPNRRREAISFTLRTAAQLAEQRRRRG